MQPNDFKINKIKIKNDSFFEDFEIELNKKFTILVGENGMGKSLFLDYLRMQSDTRNLSTHDSFEINAEISENFKIELLIYYKKDVPPYKDILKLERFLKNTKELQISNQWILEKSSKSFYAHCFFIIFFSHIRQNNFKEQGFFMDWILRKFDREDIELRQKIKSLKENETIFDIGITKEQYKSTTDIHIELFIKRVIEIRNILNNLGFEWIKPYLDRLQKKIFSEIGKETFAMTEEKHDNCSGGEMKILNIFSEIKKCEVFNQNSVIIIDEIESELHPSLQLKMSSFFKKTCKQSSNVFISTHSPFILESFINGNDCQILKFNKYGEKRKIEEQKIINKMTLGEINYEILNIADKSYHNELYDILYKKLEARNHKDFNKKLHTNYNIENIFNNSSNDDMLTVCCFVRHAIHYPNEYPLCNDNNIKDSIKTLKFLL